MGKPYKYVGSRYDSYGNVNGKWLPLTYINKVTESVGLSLQSVVTDNAWDFGSACGSSHGSKFKS